MQQHRPLQRVRHVGPGRTETGGKIDLDAVDRLPRRRLLRQDQPRRTRPAIEHESGNIDLSGHTVRIINANGFNRLHRTPDNLNHARLRPVVEIEPEGAGKERQSRLPLQMLARGADQG